MGSTTAEWRGSVAQKRGTFAGPCAGYSERGAATRNKNIPRPNVVTRRVSVERTGAVPRQSGVRPNNNNSQALFQPRTLHELWQLGLCPKMDTPDTAHPLDAKVVVAEVTHTMTNAQPSFSGGGKSNRILNTFKEAMDLPQAARLKEALNKDIASLENHVVFGLVQIASVPAGHKVVSIRWVLKLRRTVPTGVDSSCKDFGRSLASTAVAALFPSAGSRVSA